MQILNNAGLLRIFPGESDRWKRMPLYEAIVIFLPMLDKMIGSDLVILEKVKVLHYRSGGDGAAK